MMDSNFLSSLVRDNSDSDRMMFSSQKYNDQYFKVTLSKRPVFTSYLPNDIQRDFYMFCMAANNQNIIG